MRNTDNTRRASLLVASVLLGATTISATAQETIPQRQGKAPLADATMPAMGSASQANGGKRTRAHAKRSETAKPKS